MFRIRGGKGLERWFIGYEKEWNFVPGRGEAEGTISRDGIREVAKNQWG